MLLWFRNDLRLEDNLALNYFIKHRKPTDKAIVFFTSKQWHTHDWSLIKIDFYKRHVVNLQEQLAQIGIELEVVEVDDFAAQISYLSRYCRSQQIERVIVNEELEYNERQRDKALQGQGIKLKSFESDVIVSKGAIKNNHGLMYKVFTPFKKAWLRYVRQHGDILLPASFTEETLARNHTKIDCSTLKLGLDNSSKKWPLVGHVSKQVLPDFIANKLASYAQGRDFPSIKATSGFSPYLAIGALSPKYLLKLAVNRYPDILIATDTPEFSWLNELIWRDFYRHLLHHYPKLAMHQTFNDKYKNMLWSNRHDLFQAWSQGRTGYPLVDAAMRQLVQTGWMHNRLRMVTASFLTKHLLVDWRKGEKFFMQHLIDGDLAANNGGWQWAAGTGCDAQPYFRIFNPITQSEKFDPKGHFIRRYIPELSEVPDKVIHFPHHYLNKQGLSIYWPAIVEHKEARLAALAFYQSVN